MPGTWLIFIWRDLLEGVSYRLSLGLGAVGVLLNNAIFYYLAALLPGDASPHLRPYGGAYFPFVLIGLAFSQYLGTAMGTFSATIRTGQIAGTLEAILVTPTSLTTFLLASSLWPFLATTGSVVGYLLVGGFIFGADLGNANLISALVLLLMTVVAFSGLGLLSAGFVMAFKRGNPINFVIHSLSLLVGGVYYPVTILPDWLQTASHWLPLTHALRAMRLALLEGEGLFRLLPEVAALALFAVVLVPAGVGLFAWSVRKAKAEGTLIHY